MTRPAFKFISLPILLGIISVTGLRAQDRLDPVAMGAARSSVATVRGLGAIAGNPGALDLYPFQPTTLPQDLTVSAYDFGGTIGSTYFSSSEFREIFGQKPEGISDTARVRIAQLLQDDKLFANGALDLISVRYRTKESGTFGFHYGRRIYARVNFPDGFVKLLTTSNIGGQNFKFTSNGIGGDFIAEWGISYGKMFGSATEPGWFPETGIGVTAKLLQGVARFEVSDNSILTINQVNIGGALRFRVHGGYIFRSAEPDGFDPNNIVGRLITPLFPATAGTGFAGDLGISGILYRRAPLKPGAAAKDVIYYGFALQGLGSIAWNTNTDERTAIGIDDTLQNSGISNEQIKHYSGALTPVSGFTSHTPAVVRAGLGLDLGAYLPDLSGSLVISAEGEVPLNSVAGNSPDPRFALGGDWALNDVISLRTGLSAGGTNGFGIALGAGVRPAEWLTIDAGTSEINALFNGKRIDLAFRMTAGFHP
jgi:hypothetical protein